jgi:DNA mismatch endonuclease (patch repair protein)
MTDVHDNKTRSFNMSRIKGKNTKPEILIRKFLFAKGFRFRLHDNKLPGNPEIILRKYKIVIFVNGCFWHGHKGCQYFGLPKTRTEWWLEKIKGTMVRDKNAEISLNILGWRVIVIWECQLKKNNLTNTISRLIADII